MDTKIEEPEISENDTYPFVKGIVPGTMSGAEMLAYWKESGVFDVPWPQHDDIGPGKKYADSTEYVQAMRERTAEESRQELRDFAASRTAASEMD